MMFELNQDLFRSSFAAWNGDIELAERLFYAFDNGMEEVEREGMGRRVLEIRL